MKGKIRFIKTCLWIGIVGDLLSCIPLLFPEIAKKMFGLEGITVSGEYLYVARMAATLMLGWTVLLFWAVIKPIERKGVMLLTLVPVMLGLIITNTLVVTSGLTNSAYMIPVWVFNGIIIIIYILAYRFASQIAHSTNTQS